MIPSLPRSLWARLGTWGYASLFFILLFLPLAVVAVFAFNNAPYPAPPWKGLTLDWFWSTNPQRVGLFGDRPLLGSIWTSTKVALWVTAASLLVGTANAFLIERVRFPGKQALYLMMLAPLVIPGVILGISILAFASHIANLADDLWGIELEFLRPGLVLVALGQFSFVASITTLSVLARLKRFDTSLEEAAYNLGASGFTVFRTITLPYLRPALIGSAAIAFLMSFENFNTTLMLVGSDAPLTIMMYGRMREGASPVLNAVSLVLMLLTAAMAIFMLGHGAKRQGA
ncbi:MAG: ABC transporter permease [Betaproteobacteria bacterium]|nr:ABC transporter permease [Betaproteobacteria bacterium]